MKRPATIAKEAFCEIYPHVDTSNYTFIVKYSAKFKDYNANVSMTYQYGEYAVTLKLSKEWRELSAELQTGVMQHLLLKLFKKRLKQTVPKTMYTEMYEQFIATLGNYAPLKHVDPTLRDSFDRINIEFFDGLIEQPNLIWGGVNKRKMGHYDYQQDTIMISEILRDRIDLVDFVMFHEMLHKKHKYYKTQTGRHMHHHSAFRAEEALYPDFELMEKELSAHIAKKVRSTKKWWEFI